MLIPAFLVAFLIAWGSYNIITQIVPLFPGIVYLIGVSLFDAWLFFMAFLMAPHPEKQTLKTASDTNDIKREK